MNISLLDDNSSIQFTLKERFRDDKFSPQIAREKQAMIYNQQDIFVRAILSNIIIIFEKFLSIQYRILVVCEPKKYFENKTINISDIFEKNIGEILDKEIDNEVNANMFDSIKALDRMFEKSSINLDRYIKIRKEFEEIYYRRNLFVHCDGFVNEIYLSKVDSKYTKNVKQNQKLVCDDIYLENAILVLKKIISSLHCEMLHCFNASQEEYDTISDYGFEALKNSQYSLAEYVYCILRREKSFEFNYKIMYELNYINSLKQQGKDIQSLTDKLDVTIAEMRYKIAKECLLNNHETTYNLLVESYPKSFCAIMVREWPIFVDFRKTDYYTRFVGEHQEDFEVFVFEESL